MRVVGPLVLALVSGYTPRDLSRLASDTCISQIAGKDDVWDNIRISVRDVTQPESHYSKRDREALVLLRTVVIPDVVSFWQRSMKVRPVEGNLRVVSDRDLYGKRSGKTSECGHVAIPKDLIDGAGLSNTDLVLLVDISNSDDCSRGTLSGGKLASALACRRDACGRPLMGAVQICLSPIDPETDESVQQLYTTISHELTHVFGFTEFSLPLLRAPNGVPRVPFSQKKSVYYTCNIDKFGLPRVDWDVDYSSNKYDSQKLYRYDFLPGVVESIANSRVGNTCRCPFDQNHTYTSQDIEYCLTHRHECAFAITTPTVRAMSRWFFDCPTLPGAEWENQPTDSASSVDCHILDPHWKARLFNGEYMIAASSKWEIVSYVSPLTWAFLDDTGWYRMNYEMTSSLTKGVTWGFKSGCDFVNTHNPSSSEFCKKDFSKPICSADATEKVFCGVSSEEVPSMYKSNVNGFFANMDYCPVMFGVSLKQDCLATESESVFYGSEDILGQSSRCLNRLLPRNDREGVCTQVKCNGTFAYTVSTQIGGTLTIFPTACKFAGQVLKTKTFEIECADPQIICHDFAMPHVQNGKRIYALTSASVGSSDSRFEAGNIANSVDHQLIEIPSKNAQSINFGFLLIVMLTLLHI